MNDRMTDDTGSAPRHSPWIRGFILALLCAVLVVTCVFFAYWSMPRRAIDPSGGVPFLSPVVLKVPLHRQNDVRWKDDFLGPTRNRLGDEGCAIASASMVLATHGVDVDPGRLNTFAKEQEPGFTPEGWLYWEAAAAFPPGKLEKTYEDLPSYARIDMELLAGRPSIVRIRLPSGVTHFVVICGKKGTEYLIRDPAAAEGSEPTFLSQYELPIEALRTFAPIR